MSNFDLSNYVEVKERIEAFRVKHPEGSYRTELVELPTAFAHDFIAVKAYVYRSPDDPQPGVDMAWEPVPGKTPYTKDSELQNACTSAIGRAIIAALAADARRGMASAEEVRNRQQVENVTPPFDTAAYAKDAVQQFTQWTDEQRKESFKKHSNGVKPTTAEEVRKVIEGMAAEYYAAFPGDPGAPF